MSKFALTNVRIFDGDRICEPRTVIIDGETLATDPRDAVEIDCGGDILLPGLIDCHVHLREPELLQQLAWWGVTTALDMACWPPAHLRSLRQHSLDNNLTDFRSAGIPATAPGSVHSRVLPLPQEALLTGHEQAEKFVTDRVAEGSDYIKLIADVPGPDQQTLNALAAAARKHGKLSIAHASSYVPTIMALDSKVDVITHVPLDRDVDSAVVERIVTENRVYIPTLTMMEGVAKSGIRPGLDYNYSRNWVSAMHAAKVSVFVGTDANNSTGPTKVSHGESIHREMELLVEAGMSTLEVLRAATVEPAKYWGFTDRGTIAPGRRADLVLISGDPLKDIRATREIKRVWCRGVEVQRAST